MLKGKATIILFRRIVSKDSIVVTVEYRYNSLKFSDYNQLHRLGLLGFLCLDDKEAKGNYAVWDVIEALKFVKENAKVFGGDASRITVMGQSAGACLADLLSLSPVSRDLFQQTFLMAGFAENSWAISNKRVVIDFCRERALKLGFQRNATCKVFIIQHSIKLICLAKEWSGEENMRCVEFLQKVPSLKFGMTMLGDKSIINDMRLLLTPVLDDELFPSSIQELRRESKPKVSIVGVTKRK